MAAVGPAAASAEPAPGPAGWIYDPGKVVVINLTLSAEAEEALEDEPTEYVEGSFSMSTTDGIPGGEETLVAPPLSGVGIRLKGSASFRPLTGKAAFKLKFKKAEPFFGLRKMTLNNMVEDSSMLHETLAYSAFRAAGVPASRTGYAYVRLNGSDYGLYMDIENLDKVGLERWFGKFEEPPQHLYEGEDGHDVTPGGAEGFEVDEGKSEDLSDLEALIAAVNSTAGEGWSAQVAPVANLEEMTRMWAVEKYAGQWDGYAGEKKGENQPNNYFLYSDLLGRFQMFPWGTDETWVFPIAFDAPDGLMFDRCLADPACEALYRKELRAAGEAIAGLDLDSLAQGTAALLKPWEEIEPPGKREYTNEEIDEGVAATRAFIAQRPGELDAWLGPEEGEETEAAVDSSTPSGAAGQSPAPPPPPAARSRLRVSSALTGGAVLRNRLRLSAAGEVWQKVTIKTAAGIVRACSGHERVEHAGTLTIRCRLSVAVRRRLRARWLKLRLVIRFEPKGGTTETIHHEVFVPRLRHG